MTTDSTRNPNKKPDHPAHSISSSGGDPPPPTKWIILPIATALAGAGATFLALTYNPQALSFWHLTHTLFHSGQVTPPIEQVSRPDMQFIEMMVPLDEEAIAIANYASSHSQSPQIKILADQISKAHSDEVNQLRQWYKNWYTRDLQVYSSKPTVNPYANGAAVDRVFIREMIRHDQATVKMAAMVVDSARKPEIRELAQSIINKYNDEISQLTALLQQ